MDKPVHSFPTRVLRGLAYLVMQHPRWFTYPQILLFGLAVFYTVQKLEFSTSRNDLVGADKKYHRIYLDFKKEFAGQDDIVAIVESENAEKNRQFVERLGARLEKETNLFTDVFYKGDLKMLGPKALLFLPPETLTELQTTLKDYRPFIEQFAQATNLNSLFRMVNQRFRTASREADAENESLVKALPALTRIVSQTTASLNRPGTPPSPGIAALFNSDAEAEEGQYITFAKGRIYLVSARAAREDLNGDAVQRLRELVRITEEEVAGINVGITGEPVLEFDEMRQSQEDSTRATIISLVACAIIFIVGFRQTARPIKATLCLIIGLGYTMGYTTLTVGHLNILTVTFLPILIGLAIDFGVHLISRYEEELQNGAPQREALQKGMVNTGLGIFTGCFTTAGAFFAMGLTDFRGIQEMGIITGGGLLICLIPMMTFLPALLLRERPQAVEPGEAPPDRRASIERLWLDRPGLVLGITTVICVLSVWQLRKVYFDYNLLNMQSAGLPAVEFEKKLLDSASKSVLYAAVVADSLPQAQSLEKAITNLPTVASIDSMTQFLVGDQSRRLEQIGEIKRDLSTIHFAEPDHNEVDSRELSQTLFYTQSYLGLATAEVQKAGDQALYGTLRALRDEIGEFRHALASRQGEQLSLKLAAFQKALFDDIRETFHALRTQDNTAGLRVEDLPQALKNRFIGKTGKYLLQVYPKEDVWQREHQKEFVAQLRTVEPNVTGTPVQLYEYTTLLKDSYVKAAYYSLAAIAVLVFFHFRTISNVILALLPVAIGTLWMVGFMGWFGIPFNPANIMTLPLVIGIGVTNGIHILNRFAEERSPSILAKSTGKAVIVSAFTTVAGFGSLIPAKHKGIESLGLVMSVGVATCMLAAITVLPAILNLFVVKKREPSIDNAQSILGGRNRGKNLNQSQTKTEE